MKKHLLYLSLILVLATGCECDKEKSKVNLEEERKSVALVLDKYVLANESQEIDLVKEIWAPEEDIVVFGTESDEKLVGWGQIRDAVQHQFNTFEDTYISVRDQIIEVNETGNTAWFSEVINYNYIENGEAKSFEGIRFTGVLEKCDGSWKIVQSHLSVPYNSH